MDGWPVACLPSWLPLVVLPPELWSGATTGAIELGTELVMVRSGPFWEGALLAATAPRRASVDARLDAVVPSPPKSDTAPVRSAPVRPSAANDPPSERRRPAPKIAGRQARRSGRNRAASLSVRAKSRGRGGTGIAADASAMAPRSANRFAQCRASTLRAR